MTRRTRPQQRIDPIYAELIKNPEMLQAGGLLEFDKAPSVEDGSLLPVPAAPAMNRTGARGAFDDFRAGVGGQTTFRGDGSGESLGSTLGGIVRTPLDIMAAYGAAYRGLPQAYRDAAQQRQTSAQNQGQLRQLIMSVVQDPRELAVALANPQAWSEQNATRYGFHAVPGGQTMVNGPGGGTSFAPSFGVDNEGRGYAALPQGATETGRLDPSYDDETDRLKAVADATRPYSIPANSTVMTHPASPYTMGRQAPAGPDRRRAAAAATGGTAAAPGRAGTSPWLAFRR